jgi:S1-C subfamily serine protease
LRLPVKSGVLITGVLQNGPAGNGGMKPGDVVVKIADQNIANTAQLFNAVAALKPGTSATIAVQRGDRAVELKVQVALRPPSQRADR